MLMLKILIVLLMIIFYLNQIMNIFSIMMFIILMFLSYMVYMLFFMDNMSIILMNMLFVGGIMILLFYVNSLNNNTSSIFSIYSALLSFIFLLMVVSASMNNMKFYDMSSMNYAYIMDAWLPFTIGWFLILGVMFILNLLVSFLKTKPL